MQSTESRSPQPESVAAESVGKLKRHALSIAACLLVSAMLATNATAQEEFDELKALIEINATDGDVGFHVLGDAGSWRYYRIKDPMGSVILSMRARNGLADQGLTEEFFESSEPLCEPDSEEPDERVVTLAEFLARFPEGDYSFFARGIENERIIGETAFTYNLPAAPNVELTEDMVFPADDVVIMWEPGDDLGESCSDQSLVNDGIIPDPASVPVEFWEVVVEVDDDDAPSNVFVAQVPAEQNFVSVPQDFLQPFLDMGFSEFKFEIGAIEESSNATFSEGSFEVE